MKRPVFFSKDRTFEQKLRLLRGEFLKTRNFLKNTEFCVKSRLFEKT